MALPYHVMIFLFALCELEGFICSQSWIVSWSLLILTVMIMKCAQLLNFMVDYDLSAADLCYCFCIDFTFENSDGSVASWFDHLLNDSKLDIACNISDPLCAWFLGLQHTPSFNTMVCPVSSMENLNWKQILAPIILWHWLSLKWYASAVKRASNLSADTDSDVNDMINTIYISAPVLVCVL